MATISLDDGTAGKTYVAKFIRDSDGYVWDGVSAWVVATSLTDAEIASAVGAVTLSAVTNESSTHIGYRLTVPAGITVPCHISVYLTSYAAGDEEDYGYDYDPQISTINTEVAKIPRSGTTYTWTNTDTAATAEVEIGEAS